MSGDKPSSVQHLQSGYPAPSTTRGSDGGDTNPTKLSAIDGRKVLSNHTPLQFVPGIGPLRAELFERLGVRKAIDLLFLFPRSYQDVAPYQTITQLAPGVRATVVGQVVDMDHRFSFDGRASVGVLLAIEGGGYVRCVWYNQPFRREQFARGMRVIATGIPKPTGVSFEMRHPETMGLEADAPLPQAKPVPLYPLTEGLQQKHVFTAVSAALEDLLSSVEEAMPDSIRQQAGELISPQPDGVLQGASPQSAISAGLPGISDALLRIHRPDTLLEAAAARMRFIFQELLVYQLAITTRRHKLQHEKPAPTIVATPKIHSRILKRFPFSPTGDQLRVIDDIRRDMSQEIPMNRLVQGDVGSGKTVVALYALLNAVANKYQAALMVPTELLARQHFARLQQQLAGGQVMVELLVGSMSTREQNELRQRIAIGTVDIVVGTQALLSEHVQFHALGLVVIDEQHKFGVEQRAALRESRVVPHYLVMSATPIPRSLTMSLFGDLDVSVIREKPPGRAKIHTYLGSENQKNRWWEFVRKQLRSGRQAYIVIPRVDADEQKDALGVESVYEELRLGELAEFRVDMLHGRMDGDEKQSKLTRFETGQIQALVATTVIEVGIDVPNATVMTILDADRLGLAQLHQLRGRVGRGKFAGYVCLFPSRGIDKEENQRLKCMVDIDDGFQLAEEDLKMRGTGDLLGTKQVGSVAFRIADLARDVEILTVARKVAQELVASDPELEVPELAKLKKLVHGKYSGSAALGDVG